MTPKGFFSYARGDDEHLGHMLTELRKHIAGEVSMLLGQDVAMFQDIHDLRIGDRWEERLRAELSQATFLIPILTPRYYKREWCREETLTFLDLAKKKKLDPLVFPVLFVPDLFPESDCEVRAALAPFQYKDFASWRLGGPTERSRLESVYALDVAKRLHEHLHRPSAAPPAPKAVKGAPSKSATLATATETSAYGRSTDAVPLPPSYPTLVVDPMPKRGDHTSIQAAIDAAEPGSRILIRPGTYRESLRLSKSLELFGDGDPNRIVVTTDAGDTLYCDASTGAVVGLTLRREPGGKNSALMINAGAVEIENCVITSRSLSASEIRGSGTTPTLRRCHLAGGAQSGLIVRAAARPTFEDCTFVGSARTGADVGDRGSRAVFRRCEIRDNMQDGLLFHSDANGVVDGCKVIGNRLNGIAIAGGGDPSLNACHLRANYYAGVFINNAGLGHFRDCVISANGNHGLIIQKGGRPEVRHCTITGNKFAAVWIVDAESGGVFEGNDLRGTPRSAWNIAKGAEKNLNRRDNQE